MNEELLKKAMDLFDTPEKWNAFLELCKLVDKDKGILPPLWWKKLQTEVYNRELRYLSHEMPDWDIYVWGHWDIKWFIRGEDEKKIGSYSSLLIHFYAWLNGTIRVTYDKLNVDKVNKLINNNPRFDVIKTCFDRNDFDTDKFNANTIAIEKGNFVFESPFDRNFPDSQILCWYAGNRTKEFADQIIAKVRKFQTQEITDLFKEINKNCR